ncbi:uncharacterized protein AMSG_06735 [Thecamonas trahens ATCC 50062]|uniref:Uncharacterized protein n=1 Tax=Thecamonas trahens ATCC 50062 TaxID=461836 RepID=A0A0L0DES1_THETB|nr:hypothetical protein AMSG_06735 [Thecamonas trahens ATCC 50062]KNC50832.1 hypothetical protein AMSG_06735 [Thecamonas trahens ATCC 50062]|eukprot:XP_013756787.1 hypothetical protein AMSG_06735 [Thecamonas trahens ATCC 50062]
MGMSDAMDENEAAESSTSSVRQSWSEGGETAALIHAALVLHADDPDANYFAHATRVVVARVAGGVDTALDNRAQSALVGALAADPAARPLVAGAAVRMALALVRHTVASNDVARALENAVDRLVAEHAAGTASASLQVVLLEVLAAVVACPRLISSAHATLGELAVWMEASASAYVRHAVAVCSLALVARDVAAGAVVALAPVLVLPVWMRALASGADAGTRAAREALLGSLALRTALADEAAAALVGKRAREQLALLVALSRCELDGLDELAVAIVGALALDTAAGLRTLAASAPRVLTAAVRVTGACGGEAAVAALASHVTAERDVALAMLDAGAAGVMVLGTDAAGAVLADALAIGVQSSGNRLVAAAELGAMLAERGVDVAAAACSLLEAVREHVVVVASLRPARVAALYATLGAMAASSGTNAAVVGNAAVLALSSPRWEARDGGLALVARVASPELASWNDGIVAALVRARLDDDDGYVRAAAIHTAAALWRAAPEQASHLIGNVLHVAAADGDDGVRLAGWQVLDCTALVAMEPTTHSEYAAALLAAADGGGGDWETRAQALRVLDALVRHPEHTSWAIEHLCPRLGEMAAKLLAGVRDEVRLVASEIITLAENLFGDEGAAVPSIRVAVAAHSDCLSATDLTSLRKATTQVDAVYSDLDALLAPYDGHDLECF